MNCRSVAAEQIKNEAPDIIVTLEADVLTFLILPPITERIAPLIKSHTPAAIINAPNEKNESNHRTAPKIISIKKTEYIKNLFEIFILRSGYIFSINVIAEAKKSPPNTGDNTSYDDMGFSRIAVPNMTHDTPNREISHQKRMSCTRLFTLCLIFSISRTKYF